MRRILTVACTFTTLLGVAPLLPGGSEDSGAVAAQPAADPRREVLAEFANLIVSGDAGAARAFVMERFHPRLLQNAGWYTERVLLFHEWVSPSRVVETAISGSTGTIRVVSSLTGWTEEIQVSFEAEPPYRVAGISPAVPVRAPSHLPDRPLNAAELAVESQQVVTAFCNRDVFSGVVLIVHRDDEVLQHVCGLADRRFAVPNTTDTRFNIGSVQKMFTAVAIAQLIEEGKLSLDDPLSRHLPGLIPEEDGPALLLKHVLSHTSGLGDYLTQEFDAAARERFRTIDDYLQLGGEYTRAFEPGTAWRYSNLGFIVLGRLIEAVTGEEYDAYLARKVYGPAGMVSTGLLDLDLVAPGVATGYDREYTSDGIRYRNNAFRLPVRGNPAGLGYSTAPDLARFARALLRGELMTPELRQVFTSAKPELGSAGYGYGFLLSSGGRVFGHSGGYEGVGAHVWMVPEADYVLVAIGNHRNGSSAVMPRLEALVMHGR